MEISAWTFPAVYVSNYDGDTFKLRLDLGFDISRLVTVRVAGVDTPELRGGTVESKAAGKLARDEARRFVLKGADVCYLSQEWRGKYGRALGDISSDGESLVEWLIAEGLGVRYTGGNRGELKAAHAANLQALTQSGALAGYL